MPTLPAVPKVVRLDVHFSQANTANLQFRNFYQYTGTLSLADAATWLGGMQAAITANLMPVLVTSLALGVMRLTDLTSLSSPQVENATGGLGSDGNAPLNAGTSFVIKEHIVRRYRGGHPRVYLPGLSQPNLLNATRWKAASIGAILAAYVSYVNAVLAATPSAAGTGTPVNISYFKNFTVSEGPTGRPRIIPTPRAAPLVDVITNFSANPVPASQRRRNSQGV